MECAVAEDQAQDLRLVRKGVPLAYSLYPDCCFFHFIHLAPALLRVLCFHIYLSIKIINSLWDMDYSYFSNAELEGKMTSQRCSEGWNPQSSLRPVPFLPSKKAWSKQCTSGTCAAAFCSTGQCTAGWASLVYALRRNSVIGCGCQHLALLSPLSLASRPYQLLHQGCQELPFFSLASLLFFFRAHWAGLICSKTDLCTFQS